MVAFRTVGRRSNCILIFVFKSSGEYFGVQGSSSIHCLLESSGQAGVQQELLSLLQHCNHSPSTLDGRSKEQKE